MEKFLIAIVMVSALLITSSTGVQLCLYKEVVGLLIVGFFIVWWLWKHNKWLAMFVGWIICLLYTSDAADVYSV